MPAGAISPLQASASTSIPASFKVGMSGRSGDRTPVDTARTFSLPEPSCGMIEIAGRQTICTSLRNRAVTAWVGHVYELRAAFERDRFQCEMRKRAGADRAERIFPGIAVDEIDQGARMVHVERGIDGENARLGDQERDER